MVTNLPCDLHVSFIAGEVRVLTDALYSQVLDWGRLCGEERGGGVREISLSQSSVLCVRKNTGSRKTVPPGKAFIFTATMK